MSLVEFVAHLECEVDIEKATSGDKDWIVSGYPASESRDYDDELMLRSGVKKGLDFWREKMGGWADWDHQYKATKNPKFLIGKGLSEDYKDSSGRPIVAVRLFKDRDISKTIWDDLLDVEKGVHYGYSVQGRGNKDDKGRITHVDINLVTISPLPMGFKEVGIKPGIPTGSMQEIAKALMEPDVWREMEIASIPPCEGCSKPLTDTFMGHAICKSCVQKALTTGSGIVTEGEGSAGDGSPLREQELAPDVTSDKYSECEMCGKKCEKGKKRCDDCKVMKGVPQYAILKRIGVVR